MKCSLASSRSRVLTVKVRAESADAKPAATGVRINLGGIQPKDGLPLVVDYMDKKEFKAKIDSAPATAICRCWQSKTFPMCNGAHRAHNEATGDNVGPLVIKDL